MMLKATQIELGPVRFEFSPPDPGLVLDWYGEPCGDSTMGFDDYVAQANTLEHVIMQGACIRCDAPEHLVIAPGVTIAAKAVPCPGPRPAYVRWSINTPGAHEFKSDIRVLCGPCAAKWVGMLHTLDIGAGVHRQQRYFCAECGKIVWGKTAHYFQADRTLHDSFTAQVRRANGELL